MTGYGAGSQWEQVSTDRVGRRDPVDPGSTPGGSAEAREKCNSFSLFLLAKKEKILKMANRKSVLIVKVLNQS